MMFNLQRTMNLLLLVFPLIWFEATFGVKSEPNDIIVEEGSDVILPCSLSSKEDILFKIFNWKKDGKKQVFAYDSGIHSNNGRPGQDEQFKGRVSHFEDELKSGNAAIIIRNTKMADSGDYTCDFPQLQPRQILHIKLVVGVITVEEGSDVTLPCSLSSKENIVDKLFEWKKDGQKVFGYDEGIPSTSEQFKGRVSHFEDELKSGNASIIIRNMKLADSGDYTCEFPQLQQIFHIKLHVGGDLKDRTAENIPGAAPKPYVTILKQTKNKALLQCEVRGAFPKPKLHWQDSDGNILHAEEPKVTERGGSYDVILQTIVTKTDYYRCVATQEEIKHQIYSETYVLISGSYIGLVVTIVVLCLFGLIGGVALAVLRWKGDITINGKKGPCSRWTVAAIFIGLLVPVVGGVVLAVLIWKGYITIKRKKDRTAEKIKGAAPKPDIRIISQTAKWALLECEVRGAFPKPKLHWQDSDGNILHAEEPKVTIRKGSYDVILHTIVTKSDNYRCVATQEEISHQIYSEIPVVIPGGDLKDRRAENIPGAVTKPDIKILEQTENWALLQGEVRGAFPKPKLHWQDIDGNILHAEEPKVTERGGRYDVILYTLVTKSGDYRCVATQEEIKHQIYAEKHVDIPGGDLKDRRAENIPGAAPEPDIRIISQTETWALLHCEVQGAFPKPKLHWQDRAGNILHAEEPKVTERGGSYDVILYTLVTKTDYYRCVATQEEIKHQIYSEKHVNISELKDRTDENIPGAAPKPNVKKLKTEDGMHLQGEVRDAFPKPKLHWQDVDGNILHAEEPKVTERGGRYDVILHTTVTKSGNYRCVATQKEIKHQIYAETYVLISDGEPENNSGELKDRSAENIPGAAPKPDVRILHHRETLAVLQGEVRDAFPKPKLHWQDSDGNKLPAEEPKVTERRGRYDVIFLTTVTKTGNYRCVATQEEINHQTDAEIPVDIRDRKPENNSGELKDRTAENIPGAATKPNVKKLKTENRALLQCEVRGVFPKPELHWQDSDGNILHAEEPKVTERRGRYDVTLNMNVTKTGYYRCVVTQEEISHQTDAEIPVNISDILGDRKPENNSDSPPQTSGIPLNDFDRAEKERLLVDEHRV